MIVGRRHGGQLADYLRPGFRRERGINVQIGAETVGCRQRDRICTRRFSAWSRQDVGDNGDEPFGGNLIGDGSGPVTGAFIGRAHHDNARLVGSLRIHDEGEH